MFYPKCMIIVTISKWHQFSSYQAALENPAMAVLGWTEFGERKKELFLTFLLSWLRVKAQEGQVADRRCVLSHNQHIQGRTASETKSCASSPQAAGSLQFLVLAEHRGGDRTLLGSQPHQPCYVTLSTTSPEKTPMALYLCM